MAKRKRNFRQLTLEQSMRLSVAVGSDKASDETPGPSRQSRPTRRIAADTFESSGDEFSEPDLDSSDEWLPCDGLLPVDVCMRVWWPLLCQAAGDELVGVANSQTCVKLVLPPASVSS